MSQTYIAEQNEVETALQLEALNNPKARQQLLAIAEVTSDWIWITDEAHRFVYVSPKVYDHIKLRPESLVGRRRSECFNAVNDDNLQYLTSLVSRELPFRCCEYSWIGEDDEEYFVEVSGTPLRHPDGRFAGYIGSGRCITSQIRREKELESAHVELEKRATTDSLTGLYNRDYFTWKLRALCQAGERSFILILTDLDRFKRINDTYGHQVGDQALVTFAQRLKSIARAEDFVCRLGGDEFALLVLTDPLTGAEALAERILRNAHFDMDVNDQKLRVSASFGMDGYKKGSTKRCSETLISNADFALYRAKASGRGQVIRFNRALENGRREELDLILELNEAIDNNKTSACFQAIVDLKTGKNTALEALARWTRKDGTPVPPGEFIAIAEAQSLIDQLGLSTFEQAADAAASIDASVSVSVNLSAAQLGDGEFVRQFERRIKTSNLEAHRFWFEVTENVCFDNDEAVLSDLQRLADLGATVALDDFGAGHSSLFCIKHFPFTVIKLDRAFLTDLHDERSRGILEAVCTMSRALGVKMVAEGIENHEQLRLVKEFGIDMAQGYFFQRPIPLSEYLQLERAESAA
ncbi:MAG: EAL domain-containing protein [Pseudomonadota bacterium]